MPTIEVCLSPKLVPCFNLNGKTAVVIDVLRATSAMVTGLAHGVQAIRPVSTIEECQLLIEQGYIGAAERNGQVVDGFPFGNSPLAFQQADLAGKKVALTTTNGTKAIELSHAAESILVGAFLNLEAIVDYLKQENQSVVLVCAGWKDNFNLEDTLFAGAVVAGLGKDFETHCDAALAASALYARFEDDLFAAIQQSSHFHRLAKLGIEDDIKFCLQRNVYHLVPVMQGPELVPAMPQ
ncbi:MAG: 2-phosphosulfolactate phosphatase [Sphingobacteriaceae bacterium]|nr:2-phosphosulfolactate phosphatase [Sphingobacteriaceae bacterium]